MDLGGALGLEDLGAFFEGGAGGGDIVDEPDVLAADVDGRTFGRFPGEGAMKIAFPFLGVGDAHLGLGVSGAAQMTGDDGKRECGHELSADDVGELFRLVEAAETQASVVEGDGDE
jgi:hypothetical protein